MKVVFATHGARDTQTAVYSNTLARAAAVSARGHDVRVLTPDDLGLRAGPARRFLPVIFGLRFAMWLRRHGTCDLVICHSHAGWAAALLRGWLAPPGVTRLVTTFHGLEPLYYRELRDEAALAGTPLSWRYRLFQGWCVSRLIRLACRRSDLVLCLNSTEAAFLTETGWAEPGRIAVQPNFLLDELPPPGVTRTGSGVLLFLGQWDIRKGTRYLVEAFASLARRHPRLELWCVGTLAQEDAVLAAFPSDVRSRVSVWPRVHRDRLRDQLGRADLFVFPSLFEGASLALLEAMAAGLPVVTTPAGEVPDLLEDGTSALIVPPRDVGAIAAAVERLLTEPALAARLAEAGLRIVSRRQQAIVLQDYVDLLEQLAGSVPGAAIVDPVG